MVRWLFGPEELFIRCCEDILSKDGRRALFTAAGAAAGDERVSRHTFHMVVSLYVAHPLLPNNERVDDTGMIDYGNSSQLRWQTRPFLQRRQGAAEQVVVAGGGSVAVLGGTGDLIGARSK